MNFCVTTNSGKVRVIADLHVVNDGGDALFFYKNDGYLGEDGKTFVPSVLQQIASFSQGKWDRVEITE
jgi:hypothetical protein